jgi:hypothetical protein
VASGLVVGKDVVGVEDTYLGYMTEMTQQTHRGSA